MRNILSISLFEEEKVSNLISESISTSSYKDLTTKTLEAGHFSLSCIQISIICQSKDLSSSLNPEVSMQCNVSSFWCWSLISNINNNLPSFDMITKFSSHNSQRWQLLAENNIQVPYSDKIHTILSTEHLVDILISIWE